MWKATPGLDPHPAALQHADIQAGEHLEGGWAQVDVILAAGRAAINDSHIDALAGI